MKKTKLIKTVNYVIKILIIILSFGFILHRLIFKYNTADLLMGIENIFYKPEFMLLLIIVVAMMPLNWSLETLKWQYLIKKIEDISFGKSQLFIRIYQSCKNIFGNAKILIGRTIHKRDFQ